MTKNLMSGVMKKTKKEKLMRKIRVLWEKKRLYF